jgi:hypothetical protein
MQRRASVVVRLVDVAAREQQVCGVQAIVLLRRPVQGVVVVRVGEVLVPPSWVLLGASDDDDTHVQEAESSLVCLRYVYLCVCE